MVEGTDVAHPCQDMRDQQWDEYELTNLRHELEDEIARNEELEEQIDEACQDANKWQTRHTILKRSVDMREQDENHRLSNQCMIYLNLVEEYQKVLLSYAGPGQIITNNEIRRLEREGGLSL